jgi:hypothetical protein
MYEVRSSIQFVVNKYGWPNIVAEVGVRSGTNAFNILSEYPIKHITLIDPYAPYIDGENAVTEEAQNRELYQVLLTMRPLFGRVSLMLMSSVEASKFFPFEYFDYVYIDANHSYESVKEDLINWYPKTKLLAGHDYGGSHKGVVQAVDEFVSNNNLTLIKFSDRDWLIDKYEVRV